MGFQPLLFEGQCLDLMSPLVNNFATFE